MAKTIPMTHVIDVAISYIIKRQMQGRPTTLRQMSKRVGLGVPMVRGQLERNLVQYVLIPYGEKDWVTSSTEIVVKSIPPRLAERNNFTVKEVEDSYEAFMGDEELEPLEEEYEDKRINAVRNVDPYYTYRIDTQQYQTLKHELISYQELVDEGKKRGYSGSSIMRAVGGERMKYELAGALWRPYVYRNKRFYLREVLNHLDQSYKTYKKQKTGFRKMYQKKLKDGERIPKIIEKKLS